MSYPKEIEERMIKEIIDLNMKIKKLDIQSLIVSVFGFSWSINTLIDSCIRKHYVFAMFWVIISIVNFLNARLNYRRLTR